MSFFVKPAANNRDDSSLRWGRIATAAFAGAIALDVAVTSPYINQQREATVQTIFGSISNVTHSSGIHFKAPWPLGVKYTYPLYRQSTTTSAATILRTRDGLKVTGDYHAEFEIDGNADIQKLFLDLKGEGHDLAEVIVEELTIQDLLPEPNKDSASKKTEEDEQKGFTGKVVSKIQKKLQDRLNNEGWPVKIKTILTTGFKLTAESETRLSGIISLRIENSQLDQRSINARKALSVRGEEATADNAYISNLSLSPELKASVLCLMMNRDAGKVSDAFAASCFGPSTSHAAVVQAKAAAAAAPAQTAELAKK